MDPVKMCIEILTPAFADVPVKEDIPFDRPGRLVVVTLEGGTSDGFVSMPYVGITCWGTDDRDALQMGSYAADALREAAMDHALLSSAQLESLARDEWTATGQSRYHARMRLVINNEQ